MRLYAFCEKHVAGVVCRRMAGAESGGLGGMTVDHSDEQSGQDGVAAEGDHGGGRPPGDVSSGETVLLHAVNNGGRSDWGGHGGKQSCWGRKGASKDTILSCFGGSVQRRTARGRRAAARGDMGIPI